MAAADWMLAALRTALFERHRFAISMTGLALTASGHRDWRAQEQRC
jgi:hypothetical protein